MQGGATARPFITHYNALDIDTYLRIALELPLKRLIVGGLDRVFEIGRIFRNEGIDTRHNPEFTMLEAYSAFDDYTDMMRLTEDLVAGAARASIDRTTVEVRGVTIELAPPWRRVTMADLITEVLGVHVHPSMAVDEVRAVLDGLGLEYEPEWGSGRLTYEVYDELVESRVDGPVIVHDYPRETSPLAKPHRDDPSLVERFEVIVAGRELANAYSELNDPIEQLARFREEAQAKAAGDPEAGDVDLDYVRALEYGMPPAGGMGLGIDRLVMLLAEVESIREVILFPTLRPESGLSDDDFGRPSSSPDPLTRASHHPESPRHRLAHRAGRRPARALDAAPRARASGSRLSRRAAAAPGQRPRRDDAGRPAAALPRRPARTAEAPRLAGRGRAVHRRTWWPTSHASIARSRRRCRPPWSCC